MTEHRPKYGPIRKWNPAWNKPTPPIIKPPGLRSQLLDSIEDIKEKITSIEYKRLLELISKVRDDPIPKEYINGIEQRYSPYLSLEEEEELDQSRPSSRLTEEDLYDP